MVGQMVDVKNPEIFLLTHICGLSVCKSTTVVLYDFSLRETCYT